MKFKDSIARKCRYGDHAEKIWKDYEILWECSFKDSFGSVAFIFSDGREHGFAEWGYSNTESDYDWGKRKYDAKSISDIMSEKAIWFDDYKLFETWLDNFFKSDIFGAYHEPDKSKDFIQKIKDAALTLTL